MIIWITGNSESGKTTLAWQMKTANTIILDGDLVRGIYPAGFSMKERWSHNIRTAKLAKMLHNQGFDVVISLICPYTELRAEINGMMEISWIYLSGGKKHKDYPYEYEKDKYYFKKDLR